MRTETLLHDLRYGLRMLAKSPGFTAVAVVTIGLGIGANTAIFSVVNAVLLRPLPFEHPERLVTIWGQLTKYGIPRNSISQPEYADLREPNDVFEVVAAYRTGNFSVAGGERAEHAAGVYVSAEFFDVLKVRPAFGRTFTRDDERPGAAPVVILSDGIWRRRFGADPEIVGKTVILDGETATITGVMPAGFSYPARDTDLWAALTIDLPNNERGSHYLRVIARTGPGVTLERASASLGALARDLERRYPDNYQDAGWNLYLIPLHELIVGTARPALMMLLVAVGFVLLIACANVANLMLAKAAEREKEVAIRTALGAGRLRLVRQLLTESLALAVLGGGAGLLAAFWGIDALAAFAPSDLPRLDQVGVDGRVLLFSLAATLAAGVLFGIVPALHASRLSLNQTLKEGGGRASGGPRGRRAGSLLVVAEVALSLVLLAGAGLMIRSFTRLLEVDPGFDPRHVLTARMFLTPVRYREPAQIDAFYARLMERLSALPGVEAASAISEIPMGGSYSSGSMTIKDRLGDKDNEGIEVDQRLVTRDYLRAMGLTLIAGRFFDERDDAKAPGVVVVDETMARRCWGGQDPLGRLIKIGGKDSDTPWLTVVGVVRHVKQYGLDVEGREQAYFPFPQNPRVSMVLALRTHGDPADLASALRSEVAALDKDLPIFSVRTMEEVVSASVAQTRFSLLLLSAFAAAALALAAVGIYGVMAWSVSQRNHEIGIRMALGAQGEDVLAMVLRGGAALTTAGLGLGLAVALAVTHLMRDLLFQVSAVDPATYAGVAVLLGGVAMLACYLPARRATKVDPMVALRYE